MLFCGGVNGFFFEDKVFNMFIPKWGKWGVNLFLFCCSICVLCLKLDKFALNKNAFGFNWLVEFGDSIRFFALFG
jgi:hypothetical protein